MYGRSLFGTERTRVTNRLMAELRFVALAVVFIAGIAVFLPVAGLYALISFTVAQRCRLDRPGFSGPPALQSHLWPAAFPRWPTDRRGVHLRGGTLWDWQKSRDPDPHGRMHMDRFIGLDAHASSCTLGVVSPSGKRVGSHVVETNARCLIQAVRQIPEPRHMCLEEGTLSGWLHEVLPPHAERVVVTAVQESRGPKDDRRDAFGLAHALRLGAIERAVYKESCRAPPHRGSDRR